MAAEGVLTAIQRIIQICSNKENIIKQIEEIVSPVIKYGLPSEGFEFLDDVLEILKTILIL